MNAPRHTYRIPSAFTLLELVAAVAILVILGVVTMASFAGIRKTVEASKCLNQLRNLGQIAIQYGADNDNNLLPFRMEPKGNPPGFWYDHLHEYVGRARGKDGREINGVRVSVDQWFCPSMKPTKKMYHINRICGWTDGSRTIPTTYLKRGQGCRDNQSIFPLPGGLSKTAWFADPSASGMCFTLENHLDTKDSIGWNHNDSANVLFMDGHVESVKNPDFASHPNEIKKKEWRIFYGRP